jgi:hypothetical protein
MDDRKVPNRHRRYLAQSSSKVSTQNVATPRNPPSDGVVNAIVLKPMGSSLIASPAASDLVPSGTVLSSQGAGSIGVIQPTSDGFHSVSEVGSALPSERLLRGAGRQMPDAAAILCCFHRQTCGQPPPSYRPHLAARGLKTSCH